MENCVARIIKKNEIKTLREVFKDNNILELYFTNVEEIHLWLGCENNELCVELCDTHGNSVNIGNFVDITLDTMVCDIRESVLNYILSNYLYNYC